MRAVRVMRPRTVEVEDAADTVCPNELSEECGFFGENSLFRINQRGTTTNAQRCTDVGDEAGHTPDCRGEIFVTGTHRHVLYTLTLD